MTPASAQLEEKVVEQTAEVVTSAPTKEQVIAAIREEATAKRVVFDPDVPEKIYDMLEGAVARKTANPNGEQILHRLSVKELATLHDTFEVVMIGYDTSPEEGTAHALINAHFLPGSTQVLVHGADEENGIDYCHVAIAVFPIPS